MTRLDKSSVRELRCCNEGDLGHSQTVADLGRSEGFFAAPVIVIGSAGRAPHGPRGGELPQLRADAGLRDPGGPRTPAVPAAPAHGFTGSRSLASSAEEALALGYVGWDGEAAVKTKYS